MEGAPISEIPEGHSQADFMKDMNFDVDPDDPLTKAALEDHPEGEWIDILGNGQLKKKTISKGEKNIRPNRYDLCKLKIIGKLSNGEKVVECREETTVQLGDVEVIQGLDLAIALMEVGETAEIEVASRFAYGEVGLLPDIPSNATLVYTVELKSIEIEMEIDEMDCQTRKNIGNKKRERGNWWFSRNEPTLAIQCYRRALDFLNPTANVSVNSGHGEPENPVKSNEETLSDLDLQALLEDRTKVYNNLAAAQIKIEAYDAALESVENVLGCQPQNVKALFRKGKILHKKGQHSSAHATLLEASKFDPDSKAIAQELAILKEKTVRDTRDEKKLYRKMLGTPKRGIEENENFQREPSKVDDNSKSSAKIAAWSLFGGALAAAAGIIAYRFVF